MDIPQKKSSRTGTLRNITSIAECKNLFPPNYRQYVLVGGDTSYWKKLRVPRYWTQSYSCFSHLPNNLFYFELPWISPWTADEKLSNNNKNNLWESLDSIYSSSRWFLFKKNKDITKVITIPLSQQKGILHSELLFLSLPPPTICQSWSWLNWDISAKASPYLLPQNFAQSKDCISTQVSSEVEKSYI